MAKKKKNNSNNENNINNMNTENKNDGEMKKEGGDAEKKDDKGPLNVVLKVEIHCEGCASKIVKYVRGLEGVESVKADTGSNKVTVVGAVDPSKIRDKLEKKLKKKVDLISPQPKKDKEKEKENAQKPDNKSKDKPSDDKKPKEPPVTTAVLKLDLHCQGCIKKIHKTVQKTKGVLNMKVDKQKELVTVIGTMDPKALAESLKERLRRTVEIVPPKKEKESNGGDNNEKGGGGKKKKKGGGGGGGGGGAEEGGDDGESGGGGGKIEGNRMEYIVGLPGLGYGHPYQLSGYPSQLSGYPYPLSGYGYGYPAEQVHAPQMFSDENPNACSVM
ncbi:heavy metal-associated isoprenylated plant protein 3-like [Mangifera indica]|uniref:heavy metal-associated isoprenylated plant protein 3-like n=1 Tax=Mangifera indica TaxID=29780 RepID=UPI001CFB1DAA|nr:heavy metal-associated isoprenylated plant protein 3-like [Mangifera indica]